MILDENQSKIALKYLSKQKKLKILDKQINI